MVADFPARPEWSIVARVLVVSGTRRSGTSMWMQVLAAAGIPVIGEAFPGAWSDTLRDANPHGFYESLLRHGVYWRTNPHPQTGEFVLPEQVRGHAVKVFIPGVIRTDRVWLDRVLVSVRPWREYEASIHRLYALEDAHRLRTAPGRPAPQRMPPALEWWDENFALVRDVAVRGYACHFQAYDGVLADPRGTIIQVLEWLGGGDLEPAVAAVRPESRTQRAPTSTSVAPAIAEVFDAFYAAVARGDGLDGPLIARMNAVHRELLPQIQAHHEALAAARGLLYREDDAPEDDAPTNVLPGEWS